MELRSVVDTEAAKLVSVVRSTLSFSITFGAANELMSTASLNSGAFTVVLAMGLLMTLIGLQTKVCAGHWFDVFFCGTNNNTALGVQVSSCWPTIRGVPTAGSPVSAPVARVLVSALDTAVAMVAMFVSNLVARVLVNAASMTATPLWTAWWAVLALAMVAVYETMA